MTPHRILQRGDPRDELIATVAILKADATRASKLSGWRDVYGRYLLRENAVRGFEIPTEKNPRRPVATKDRHEAVRAKADDVKMEIRWDGHRRVQRSYLGEILNIAEGTGRRISAICSLRYQDLVLTTATNAPHGAIRWPAETDKEGFETMAPISPRVRAAIDRILRERPGIGARYLFPGPTRPDKPVSSDRAGKWLREAEQLAQVLKQSGGLWHPYRRGWATARKHLPLKDVAAAGGWRCTETLLRCYQQPDDETMLSVVFGGAELREKKA